MDILSVGMPAWTNRSMAFASTPQVIGLMNPSGGGGMNEVLILSNCETNVGSFGIQLPMTIRPPGFVTRTISFATSKGFGANIAPKMLTTKSKRIIPQILQVRRIAFLKLQVRQALLLRALVAGLDEVPR